jgi:hypothetical protein
VKPTTTAPATTEVPLPGADGATPGETGGAPTGDRPASPVPFPAPALVIAFLAAVAILRRR